MSYYQKNKEKLQKQHKIYYENNKEWIAEKKNIYMAEYREKNKEKIKTPIKCECGILCLPNNMTRHIKTKKHISLMETGE